VIIFYGTLLRRLLAAALTCRIVIIIFTAVSAHNIKHTDY